MAGAAPAQSQPFVYVANQGSGIVSQYDAMGGALSALAPATVAAGQEPTGVAISPDGKSVYVTNLLDNTVSQYDVGAGGALTPKTPATVAAGNGPEEVAISPDGKSIYVTNQNAGTVSQYDVGAGGALSAKTPATVAAGRNPFGIAISPDGKSVYVTNVSDNTVSQYDVGAGGALSAKAPATVAAGRGSFIIAISPDGESVYVTNFGDSTVSQYDVGAGGALSAKTPATVAAGRGSFMIAISPNGKSVYVTNANDDTVSQYDVGARGALNAKMPATVATGGFPVGIAVSPDGKSAYVTSYFDNTVAQYDVGSGGALTAKTPATVAAGTQPTGIAVTPLPAKHPTATSLRCSPSAFAPGDAAVCTATVSDTATSGQTTPTGTVSFMNSGAGGFLGSPCALSGSGASASCAVFFSAFPRGGQGITASYSGDAAHSASTGTTIVLVAVPTSTDGCLVFGHGRITAANGDRASFRGLAATSPPAGVEFYRDKGSANALRVRSLSADAVTCSTDATKASIFGIAAINGAGSVEYRIDVTLTAWEWGRDTYRIRLSNGHDSGYDSGPQPIRHGDVEIRIRDAEHHHHDRNADQNHGGPPDGG